MFENNDSIFCLFYFCACAKNIFKKQNNFPQNDITQVLSSLDTHELKKTNIFTELVTFEFDTDKIENKGI